MSTTKRSPSWWAETSTRARLTALGAGVIVVALATTSVIVWTSPTNPVGQAIAASITESAADRAVLKERNKLLSELVALKSEMADATGEITATKAEMASIQQALWSAEGKLEAIEAARAAKPPTGGGKSTTPSPFKAPAPATPTIPAAVITAPSKAELLNPASSYFGLYTEQAPFNWATYDSTATKIGWTPNLVGYFGGWDENFRANAVTRAWEKDTLPILTWESRPITSANDVKAEPEYSLPLIIGDPAAGIPGTFDDYLRQYARDIVATGLPLGIRLNHEMNGNWYPWSEDDGRGNPINGNRPGDYVKSWQHVHDIFEAEGANELVMWIWSPNVINKLPQAHKPSAYLDSLYPGDEYVDWVGLSGYLRPTYEADNPFTFDYTYGPSLAELRRITDKPILIAEIGASEIGGHKAAWVTSLFESLARPENDDIVGLAWFNLAVTSYVEGERATNDWRIDSRADSLSAFSAGLARPDGDFVLEPK